MIFLHSRSKQLANYLRNCIAQDELKEPLPGIRAWCESLGVSSKTLHAALKILQHEGLLIIQPCKIARLKLRRRQVIHPKRDVQPAIRILYYGRNYPDLSLKELPGLSEHLRIHGVAISLEKCTHARLKAISQNPVATHELLLLCSVPAAYHRYFDHMTRNVLIAGHPCPGSPLSSITVDLESAVCHAARSCMRRNFGTISLLINRARTQGIHRTIRGFHQACHDWPRQPIQASTIQIHAEWGSMLLSARRFAAHVKPGQAVLVAEPVPVSLITTVLLERGIAIPRDIEMIALNTSSNSVKVYPCRIHYPYPLRASAKSLADAAIHFFETGALPRVRKAIPMEVVAVAT